MPSPRQSRQRAIAAGAPGRPTRSSAAAIAAADPKRDLPARAVLDTIGREHLITVLQGIVPPEDELSPYARLLAYLQSTDHTTHSLTLLMRNAGLTLNEIVDVCRNYNIAIGTLRAAAHVPDVLEDIAEDARSRVVACPVCHGLGTEAPLEIDDELAEIIGSAAIPPPDDCPTCAGSGALRQIGSNDARKLLFESMGLIKRAPLVAVQRNTQINNYGGGAGAPEDVSARVAELLSK